LRDLANHMLSLVASEVGSEMAIIGVGGIMTAEDAAEKIRLGAHLVQTYTGFIYEGPELIYRSAQCIAELSKA
jgi:dihydroorotate dehydrogenase